MLYLSTQNIFNNTLYGKKIAYYKMPYEKSIDINYEYELKQCGLLI